MSDALQTGPELALMKALREVSESARQFVDHVPPITNQRSVRIQRRLDLWAVRRAGLMEALATLAEAQQAYSAAEAERERVEKFKQGAARAAAARTQASLWGRIMGWLAK